MRKRLLIPLLVIALSLFAHFSSAQEKNLPLIVKTDYFSLYGQANFDVEDLLWELNYNYFLQGDNLLEEPSQDPKVILKKTMDALFLEASDILGIHAYSFHCKIKFYPDKASLKKAYGEYAKGEFEERSFYVHEKKTLYVSYPDLTLGMLGHEIAHAIQSHYFVVPPPPKVQEILSGYVEYSLRKSTNTLPKQ